jgi:hypothetical protein
VQRAFLHAQFRQHVMKSTAQHDGERQAQRFGDLTNPFETSLIFNSQEPTK